MPGTTVLRASLDVAVSDRKAQPVSHTPRAPPSRYLLYEAESKGLELPYACRMGCCTACAVKVESGELYQPQSLGISQGLKDQASTRWQQQRLSALRKGVPRVPVGWIWTRPCLRLRSVGPWTVVHPTRSQNSMAMEYTKHSLRRRAMH